MEYMKEIKTRKQAIQRAKEIDQMLFGLRIKIDKLTEAIIEIEDGEDFDDFSLRALRQTLEDLRNFDLEDAIINAEE